MRNLSLFASLTMALLLAQARNVPQAHAALKAGRWERAKWEGVELYAKTLGVVGLGKIGALVARGTRPALPSGDVGPTAWLKPN